MGLRTTAHGTDTIHMEIFGKEMDGLTETDDKAKEEEVVVEEAASEETEASVED